VVRYVKSKGWGYVYKTSLGYIRVSVLWDIFACQTVACRYVCGRRSFRPRSYRWSDRPRSLAFCATHVQTVECVAGIREILSFL
jgi:hypothetical protein